MLNKPYLWDEDSMPVPMISPPAETRVLGRKSWKGLGELGKDAAYSPDARSMREAQQGWYILGEMSHLCRCREQERGGRAEM